MEEFVHNIIPWKKAGPSSTKKKGLLAARKLDKPSAELLKKSAWKHGLYLLIKERSPLANIKPVLSLYLLIASIALLVVIAVVPWWVSPSRIIGLYPSNTAFLKDVAVAVVAAILLERAAFWFYKNEHEIPRLTSDDYARGVDTFLIKEYGWLDEIAPVLSSMKSADMQTFNSKMIEKYFLLWKHTSDLDRGLVDRMERLIGSAAQLALVVSDLDTAVDDSMLADWNREYRSYKAKSAVETDTTRRRELERKAELAAEKLRGFDRLDAKRGQLIHRLIHLQYAFNTLLGKSLVLHADLGDSEASQLEDDLQTLKRDFAICKEVRKELSELV